MEMKPIYIHYGNNKFVNPNPIINEPGWVKPKGGLWASRRDDPDGWRAWCEREEFRLDSFDKFFEFTLKDGARILFLNNVDQLDALPKTGFRSYDKNDRYSTCNLDFEKLQNNYDAVELLDISRLYWPLYGWDCNCILIMNPDIVEVQYG